MAARRAVVTISELLFTVKLSLGVSRRVPSKYFNRAFIWTHQQKYIYFESFSFSSNCNRRAALMFASACDIVLLCFIWMCIYAAHYCMIKVAFSVGLVQKVGSIKIHLLTVIYLFQLYVANERSKEGLRGTYSGWDIIHTHENIFSGDFV